LTFISATIIHQTSGWESDSTEYEHTDQAVDHLDRGSDSSWGSLPNDQSQALRVWNRYGQYAEIPSDMHKMSI